ncbi:hypothetical protein PVNG_05471 [Plasmodium vivax North Korean]|uniref:Surface-related antigen SRA n=1 Tax=Plasmodium vivax North Korean TaxID=1035514 RepID=A0A0J9TS07_PLAVI|nr:hypothetical protein PVNG_05471 [Plasmodium vivax North Korean]
MFWKVKGRAFAFVFLSYASFVHSDKAVNLGNALAGGISGGISGGLSSGLASGISGGLSNSAAASTALLHAAVGKGPNMHTCQSAGCASYKSITPSDAGDCLNGFICKECKRTHAKNPNICFYSSLQGFESLYEAHLEDFTQPTPYDRFNVPLVKSSKGENNRGDASSDSGREVSPNDESGDHRRGSLSQGGDDDGEKGDLQRSGRDGKAGGSRFPRALEEEEEEEEEEEDDDDDSAKEKRGGHKGGNSPQGGNNGGNNFDAGYETESFLQKSPDHVHRKGDLHKLAKEGGREQHTNAHMHIHTHMHTHTHNELMSGKEGLLSSVETHVRLGISEGGYNRGASESPGRHSGVSSGASVSMGTAAHGGTAAESGYSFAESERGKEKIVYKRLKISLNNHEEYFKSKMNKCHVGGDGVATLYVKVLLQIVKDKNDVYVDVSRRSGSSHMSPGSGGQKGKEGKKANGRSESGEEEEEEEDAEESDDDEYMRKSQSAMGGGGYGYRSGAETDSDSDSDSDGGRAAVNRYAYVELHGGAQNKAANEAANDAAKKAATWGAAKEPLSLLQVREDLDGDSMGNYYKSRNGFFKSIFKRVFKKKGDSDEDAGGGDDEDSDEEPQGGKKKRRWRFPWKRRRGKGSQLQGGDDNDDEGESEDESRSTRRRRGGRRGLFGRSNRKGRGKGRDESDDGDDGEEGEDSDDEEASGGSGQRGAKKGKRNGKGSGTKGGRFEETKSKMGSLFAKVKRKILPVKQKLHIEAFFNSIIVKSCRNALKWEGNMFRKQSLVEMTLKVPVKLKYIKGEPLHFFRSGYEVILTCRNCDEVLFNSCVQVGNRAGGGGGA